MKRILVTAMAALMLGGLLAGCGDDDGDDTSDTTTTTESSDTTTTTEASGDATVAVAESSLGEVLVDSEGYTLYLFQNDQGTESACTGGCLEIWPPLTSENPEAGEGVDASLLDVAEQSDGRSQVTYNGHLLYTYAQDTAPGDVEGQGVADAWYAVTPEGEAASAGGASSGGSSSTTSSTEGSSSPPGY